MIPLGSTGEFLSLDDAVRRALAKYVIDAAAGRVPVLIGAGTYFLSQAYRVAQPAVVAPFEYSALPLALLWGVLVWGDWPDATAALGMSLIAGSGLYVFYRETMTAPPAAVGRLLRRGRWRR